MYIALVQNFSNIPDRHASLKYKYIRRNTTKFMNKELRKTIMKRSTLRNDFSKIKSDENWRLFAREKEIYWVRVNVKQKNHYIFIN